MAFDVWKRRWFELSGSVLVTYEDKGRNQIGRVSNRLLPSVPKLRLPHKRHKQTPLFSILYSEFSLGFRVRALA